LQCIYIVNNKINLMPQISVQVSMETLRALNEKHGANNVATRLSELATEEAGISSDEGETSHTFDRSAQDASSSTKGKASLKEFDGNQSRTSGTTKTTDQKTITQKTSGKPETSATQPPKAPTKGK
jgi:hypothetical protein